jgi:hypothetical protein
MTRLSGTWTLQATDKQADWDQRVLITGSTNADGAHPMVVGTVIPNVRGLDIDVKMQAFNPGIRQWLDSFQIEIMSWDAAKGVVVTISADDRTDTPDADYNDLIVECTSSDPELVPPRFDGPRLDLTVPRQYVGEKGGYYPQPRPYEGRKESEE